jgi:hypothetical protein
MAQSARSRTPIVLLTLALAASPALAAGAQAARTAAPAAPGIFASLWNAFHEVFLAARAGDSGVDPEDAGSATAPPPPAGDPDRGLTIDPWG